MRLVEKSLAHGRTSGLIRGESSDKTFLISAP
jgi:hypothetical protein